LAAWALCEQWRPAVRQQLVDLAVFLGWHEAQLAQELEQLIELDQLPDLNALTQLLAPPKGDVPQVPWLCSRNHR
jgi:hypothetical protein